MRRCLVLVFVLLATALVLSAADVTGTWKGTFTPDNGNEGPALVVLKQTGDTIVGTAGPDLNERHEIVNGKVSGDKVTFELAQEGGKMKFVLTLAGDTLTGQATRERDGQQQSAKLNLKREQ